MHTGLSAGGWSVDGLEVPLPVSCSFVVFIDADGSPRAASWKEVGPGDVEPQVP